MPFLGLFMSGETRKTTMKNKTRIDPKKPFFDNGAPPVWVCHSHQAAYYKSPISLSGAKLPCCEVEAAVMYEKKENDFFSLNAHRHPLIKLLFRSAAIQSGHR